MEGNQSSWWNSTQKCEENAKLHINRKNNQTVTMLCINTAVAIELLFF